MSQNAEILLLVPVIVNVPVIVVGAGSARLMTHSKGIEGSQHQQTRDSSLTLRMTGRENVVTMLVLSGEQTSPLR